MRVRAAWKLVVSAFCVLAALFVVAALSPKRTAGPCRMIGDVAMLRDVPEASGLAVSRRHARLVWTHNDSGNETVLFAVDESGMVRGRVRVPLRTRDWEDISAGSCATGDCLYIGDIGDNDLARRNIQVFRVTEPDPRDAQTATPDAFTLTYPDGPHNAEALFLVGTTVYIITRDGVGELYRSTLPLGENPNVTLERLGQLGLMVVSDAESSRDERSVVVRNSDEVVVYRTADLLGGKPAPVARIPVADLREPQGEGVALDGDVLYLASEGRPWNRAGRLLGLRCSGLSPL